MLTRSAYTCLELLITVALVAIISCFAIPGWSTWRNTADTSIQVNQLIAAINFARSEAIKRNTTVSICPSSDGQQCSGAWNDGYMVFINKDKAEQIHTATDRLHFYSRLSSQGVLIWHGKGLFHLSPLGFIQNGVFSYCPKNKDLRFAREVVISTTGRIRVARHLTWPCPDSITTIDDL